MKKISYLVIAMVLSLFYLACSTEESVKTSESNAMVYRLANPDVGVAKSLYIDMMATTEYADFKSSMTAFNTKLKNNPKAFDNKSDWMDWINDSISVTNFTDKVEFETMYDDMIDKFDDLVKQNEDFFDYLADAEADQIHEIYQPEYESGAVIATIQNSCEDGCMDWFDGVAELLQSVFEASTEIANTATAPGVCEEAMANAEAAYWRAYISNALLFDQCMANCS